MHTSYENRFRRPRKGEDVGVTRHPFKEDANGVGVHGGREEGGEKAAAS